MSASRFALVPIDDHHPPDNAIMHGSMSAVLERIADSRARSDAIDLIHRADGSGSFWYFGAS